MSGVLRKAIQQAAGTDNIDLPQIVLGSVVSVDIDTRTCVCTALTGGAEVDITARLMAEVDDGFLLLPTVGSTIIVCYSKTIAPYVSLFSEIDKVVLITGGQGYQISNEGVVINGGSFGGLVKVGPLVTKLNNIEKTLNSLIQKYNTHVHTGGTISGSTAIPTVTDTDTLTTTQKADLENTKVTHGSSL